MSKWIAVPRKLHIAVNMWQRSVYLQMTCLRAFFPFKKEKLFAVTSYRLAYHFSYKYNHRRLYLHHNIPARQLHLRTKTGFRKKNTYIKTCELVIPFNTFTIASGIQNTALPVWYDAKVSIQTLVASGVVCACPITTISWLMMTSCTVLVS